MYTFALFIIHPHLGFCAYSLNPLRTARTQWLRVAIAAILGRPLFKHIMHIVIS